MGGTPSKCPTQDVCKLPEKNYFPMELCDEKNERLQVEHYKDPCEVGAFWQKTYESDENKSPKAQRFSARLNKFNVPADNTIVNIDARSAEWCKSAGSPSEIPGWKFLPDVCVHNTHKCVFKDGDIYSENPFGSSYSVSPQTGVTKQVSSWTFPEVCSADDTPICIMKKESFVAVNPAWN